MAELTHFRKVFDSPYLSAVDITEPTVLTIRHVVIEQDKTKKTKDIFNTAYFLEPEIRKGEKLKPMILNATNSKTLSKLAGSPFIENWQNIRVTVYVDHDVKFGRDTVEGLRINTKHPVVELPLLTPEQERRWQAAKDAFRRDGNLSAVLGRARMSEEHQSQLMAECATSAEKEPKDETVA